MAEAITRPEVRARIVEAAEGLLSEGGPTAVTTRGVAERAGIQAPTIYRLFGDKDGLLEAVLEHVMSTRVAAKADDARAAAEEGVDPVEDLRAGWREQVAFGLEHPALFRLLSDPARVASSPAARSGYRILHERIRRVALAGRLRVSEATASALVQAAGIGVIQSLLATPEGDRDPRVPGEMEEAVLRQILTDEPAPEVDGVVGAAVTLRAAADGLPPLSPAERRLLAEWLDRLTG